MTRDAAARDRARSPTALNIPASKDVRIGVGSTRGPRTRIPVLPPPSVPRDASATLFRRETAGGSHSAQCSTARKCLCPGSPGAHLRCPPDAAGLGPVVGAAVEAHELAAPRKPQTTNLLLAGLTLVVALAAAVFSGFVAYEP
ncbi:hypothetical protein [Dactylosporangium sp. NPDC051484]|uniref:hypothetical protein n=1 Tax=Dactylosporangium sp. NPDC051484 TaxID=3154942 RepID=UPI003450970E